MIHIHEVNIDGSLIRYRTAGDKSKEMLVFLHGWTGLTYARSSLLEELEKHFYVIAPEHPGLLHSEPLKEYVNIFEQYADTVKKVLLEEGLDQKKFILLGQSFGGIVAGTFAEKYGENIKALVLTDSQMGTEKQDFLRRFLIKNGKTVIRTYLRMPNFIKRHGLKIFFGIISKSKSGKHNNALIGARVPMIDNCTTLLRKAGKENNNLLNREYADFSIVMIWGDKDGKEFNVSGFCPVGDAEKLCEHLKSKGKNAKLITVQGSHTVLYDKPEYVVGEIRKCLVGCNL